jgi:hypothetical protein
MDDANSDPLVSDLHFCSEAEFQEGNARLKILELREQGHPAFCNMKMIPPNARELPEGLLKVVLDSLFFLSKSIKLI